MPICRLLVVAMTFTVVACGSDTGPVVPSTPVVARVDLTIPNPTLLVGQSAQATATPRDDKGMPMTAGITYASSSTGVATVSGTGLVTAVAPGTATITATAGTRVGSVAVTVQPVPAASVVLTPGRTFLVTGDSLQFAAVVRDSVGGTVTSQHAVTWSLSDSSVARVSATGQLIPLKAGRVTVRATASGRSAESMIDIAVGRGVRVPELMVYDTVVPALLTRLKLPGASFAVMKDGRLVGYRTYGYADTVARQVVEPNSVFRFASLSKAITATAVLKLVEQGRVRLDDKVFTLLSDLTPPPGRTADVRLADITLYHALTHMTGWNATVTEDPLWSGRIAARNTTGTFPPSPRAYASEWMGRPLSFAPGTDWSYGQIGYVLAHLVIEKVSGKSYEQFVRDEVLTPAGAPNIRAGRSELSGRLPNEVRYYYYPGTWENNMAAAGTVPPEYGWHDIEGNIAAAGWTGTAVDHLRFIAAIDGNAVRADVLSAASLATMIARPPTWTPTATTWYGMGWYSRGGSPNPVIYHGGNTWGTLNWTRRTDTGVTFTLLTNGPSAPNEVNAMSVEINNVILAATAAVTTWPTTDLFARF